MAASPLQTVWRLARFHLELRKPSITTEIVSNGLGLTQHFIFICFEFGNFSARNFVEYREVREFTSPGQ